MIARTESELLAIAVALGALTVPTVSDAEQALVHRTLGVTLPRRRLAELQLIRTGAEHERAFNMPSDLRADVAGSRIVSNEDPLGEALCALRSADERRPMGAVYTPQSLVLSMLTWAMGETEPQRIVDPGVGSARFLVSAGRMFPRAQLVGVEIDPLAALLARAHLAAAGMAERSQVVCADYREAPIGDTEGKTLYLGNPPYVRHHQIDPVWKQWYADTARVRGFSASQLAGLHAHFFLATAQHARPGDAGIFVTAAEWLDVNYGKLVRDLLLRDLGLETLVMVEPTAMPFEGTATTAVITAFHVGRPVQGVRLGRAARLFDVGRLLTDLRALPPSQMVRRERLEAAPRWTPLIRGVAERRTGHIQLGELFRVHRGQVTGANRVWIAGAHSRMLPESVLYPTVTRARELIRVRDVLGDATVLKRVIDLPIDLEELPADERRAVEQFLIYAREHGAANSYVAQHRRAWWSVGLRAPAPILATYMARRPPVFVRNQAAARHINVAHGLYPLEPLDETVLRDVALYLSRTVTQEQGRTYAGGLTKFEPREMERLLIPEPAQLAFELAQEVSA